MPKSITVVAEDGKIYTANTFVEVTAPTESEIKDVIVEKTDGTEETLVPEPIIEA